MSDVVKKGFKNLVVGIPLLLALVMVVIKLRNKEYFDSEQG